MSTEPIPATAPNHSPHSLPSIVVRVLAAVAVAAVALLVEQSWLSEAPARKTYGAKVKPFEIESDLLERTLPARIVVPKKAPPKERSLVVFLHGRGEDERSYLVDPMFEALSNLQGRAPVIAFPYGGESSYWHNRDSGAWGSYVIAEAIPQIVRRFDIDPDRVAIGGISMGGFGAFDIARIEPARFCAVAGHSPAIWESASETAEGAFDDADDFERHDVIAIASSEQRPYSGLRVWLDAGDEDPFLAGDRAFEDAVRDAGGRPVVKSYPGGHDSDYWNGNWDEYLRFYAHALGHCDERAAPADVTDAGSLRPRSDEAPRGGRRGGAAQPGRPDRETP